MQSYHDLKMRFKSKTKDVVKQKDAQREGQTMNMLERFKNRLGASNQKAILFDKKIEVNFGEKFRKQWKKLKFNKN